jgi:hypothetical protein
MSVHHIDHRSRNNTSLAMGLAVSIALCGALSVHAAQAQTVNPTSSYKVPPRPILSGNVKIQPGMSKKDWNDAYKETGRPKFQLNTVKRVGGTVERD